MSMPLIRALLARAHVRHRYVYVQVCMPVRERKSVSSAHLFKLVENGLAVPNHAPACGHSVTETEMEAESDTQTQTQTKTHTLTDTDADADTDTDTHTW
eukprot:2874172-Rhodomonas_salina.1